MAVPRAGLVSCKPNVVLGGGGVGVGVELFSSGILEQFLIGPSLREDISLLACVLF